MTSTTLLGLSAGILTTVAFIPQVMKTCKTKSTEDISLAMFSTLTCGILLWLVYGFIKHDLPLVASNLVTFILSSVILYHKLKYK